MIHWLWYTLPLVMLPGVERLLSGPCPPLRNNCAAGRVMAVAAHPDDLEYFCGGTLHQFVRGGAEVIGVLATRGELGGAPEVREREQAEASRIIGYHRMHQLGLPDRSVRAEGPRLQEMLRGLFDKEQPDLLLTFDVDFPYPVYKHADHLAVAWAALTVWEGPAWLFHTRRPTLAFDITEAFETKLAAFGAHRSQLAKRGTGRLVGWHLGSRNRHRGDRYVEVFREHR